MKVFKSFNPYAEELSIGGNKNVSR